MKRFSLFSILLVLCLSVSLFGANPNPSPSDILGEQDCPKTLWDMVAYESHLDPRDMTYDHYVSRVRFYEEKTKFKWDSTAYGNTLFADIICAHFKLETYTPEMIMATMTEDEKKETTSFATAIDVDFKTAYIIQNLYYDSSIVRTETPSYETVTIPNSTHLTIHFFDFGIVDGDNISVIYGDEVIIDREYMSHSYRTIEIDIDEDGDTLDFVAHNLGIIPPNTVGAVIVLEDGTIFNNPYIDAEFAEYLDILFNGVRPFVVGNDLKSQNGFVFKTYQETRTSKYKNSNIDSGRIKKPSVPIDTSFVSVSKNQVIGTSKQGTLYQNVLLTEKDKIVFTADSKYDSDDVLRMDAENNKALKAYVKEAYIKKHDHPKRPVYFNVYFRFRRGKCVSIFIEKETLHNLSGVRSAISDFVKQYHLHSNQPYGTELSNGTISISIAIEAK